MRLYLNSDETAASSVPELDTLTSAQEAELVSDEKMLLVTVCALNQWTIAEMVSLYRITEAETIRRLRILDRMGVIELLPGDRIRRRARRDFDWLPAGPIKQYFSKQGVGDFLGDSFDRTEESLDFSHGMLTAAAQAELKVELRRLRRKLASLHEESTGAALLVGNLPRSGATGAPRPQRSPASQSAIRTSKRWRASRCWNAAARRRDTADCRTRYAEHNAARRGRCHGF